MSVNVLLPLPMHMTEMTCQMLVMQALQEMRKLRTEKTAEVKEFKLRLEHLKTHKDHSTKLKSDIAEGQEKDRNYMAQINEFEQEVQVTCDRRASDSHFLLECQKTLFTAGCHFSLTGLQARMALQVSLACGAGCESQIILP